VVDSSRGEKGISIPHAEGEMQVTSKVVVRFKDGRILKGHTFDLSPGRQTFHVSDMRDETKVIDVSVDDLMAVFYVKSFEGNPQRAQDYGLEALTKVPGMKLKVTFTDGEVLYGTTNGYQPGRRAFFVLSSDKGGNNERVYIITAATKSIEILK
jgi:hypothetical protein